MRPTVPLRHGRCARTAVARTGATRAVTTLAVAGLAASAAAGLAACGATTHTTTTAPPGAARPSPAPALVDDAATAAALGRSLLGRVTLPAGAEAVRSAPSAALDEPPTTPATPDLSDSSRFATVDLGADAAMADLRTHPPAGAAVSGSGRAGGRSGTTEEWVTETVRAVPAGVESATLLLSVAPLPVGSGIRVDAEVTWLPPKPVGFTVPAGDAVAVVDVTEADPSEAARLGFPAPRRVTVTDPGTVATLRRDADGLPTSPPGARSCPADIGTGYGVAFAPRVGADADITFTADTCGQIVATTRRGATTVLGTDAAFTAAYRAALGLPADGSTAGGAATAGSTAGGPVAAGTTADGSTSGGSTSGGSSAGGISAAG